MLSIKSISKSFSGRTLFADACLQINRRDRIGIVGRNGAGKSTLFSIILGETTPDSGVVALERGAKIGHRRVPQQGGSQLSSWSVPFQKSSSKRPST